MPSLVLSAGSLRRIAGGLERLTFCSRDNRTVGPGRRPRLAWSLKESAKAAMSPGCRRRPDGESAKTGPCPPTRALGVSPLQCRDGEASRRSPGKVRHGRIRQVGGTHGPDKGSHRARETSEAGGDSLGSMLKTARDIFRRFGFVGMLVLTLAMALPVSETQACAPAPGTPPATSASAQADECGSRTCEDCGLGCSHGCCHAPHVGMAGVVPMPMTVLLVRARHACGDTDGLPAGPPDGPERPPRT